MTRRDFEKPAFSFRKKRSIKTHALSLLGTKNLHFATAPFPRFSARDQYLPDYGKGNPPPDKYLRETMFGASNPRKSGAEGLASDSKGLDMNLPGFGAFGTTGHHFFNESHPAYRRIQYLIAVRQSYPTLRYGRQYLRQIRNFGAPFTLPAAGELLVWSRILDEEEILCVVNSHGNETRGADILVDWALNSAPSSSFTVIANSLQIVRGGSYTGNHALGSSVSVKFNGNAFIEIRDLDPSETLVLTNKP